MSNGYEILQTRRLILRRLQPSDIQALADLWTDPEVTQYMGGPRDRARLLATLEDTAHHPLRDRYDLWPVVEKQSGRVIGNCGLLEKEVEGKDEIELVYVLARSAWGRGYATEMAEAIKQHAFDTLGLRRLIALMEPDNQASERVAIKIGMRLEKEVVRPGGALRRVYVVKRVF